MDPVQQALGDTAPDGVALQTNVPKVGVRQHTILVAGHAYRA